MLVVVTGNLLVLVAMGIGSIQMGREKIMVSNGNTKERNE
jgi:hypothetical protein